MTPFLGWTGPGPSPYPAPWLEVPIFPLRECRQLGGEDKGGRPWETNKHKNLGRKVLEARWNTSLVNEHGSFIL